MTPRESPPAGARLVTGGPERAPQTASFTIGMFGISVVARTGSATLGIEAEGTRDDFLVDPATLGSWGETLERLLVLEPSAATGAKTEAESTAARLDEFVLRSPFLMDTEQRAVIAFECAVTRECAEYVLLIADREGGIGCALTDADTLRSVIEAAKGAAAFSATTWPGAPAPLAPDAV